ncbi:uncharacterized protein BDR25DRAFT_352121 [Lindgomyces ingoldianus]|uniref:Uncharacterized protein n=1 Tax=Lindgomyces ingoldianus TaxID=673940 RepID=A0ACB6R5A4_9PLEO|nr:uncharacterized protein BDR25DRAFT_352121 [Lindgomyces ingoldianus]KAF2473631.1 hypothetical protein BDR25DRAFT_352121 [Lindgomyces ingoldianus]
MKVRYMCGNIYLASFSLSLTPLHPLQTISACSINYRNYIPRVLVQPSEISPFPCHTCLHTWLRLQFLCSSTLNILALTVSSSAVRFKHLYERNQLCSVGCFILRQPMLSLRRGVHDRDSGNTSKTTSNLGQARIFGNCGPHIRIKSTLYDGEKGNAIVFNLYTCSIPIQYLEQDLGKANLLTHKASTLLHAPHIIQSLSSSFQPDDDKHYLNPTVGIVHSHRRPLKMSLILLLDSRSPCRGYFQLPPCCQVLHEQLAANAVVAHLIQNAPGYSATFLIAEMVCFTPHAHGSPGLFFCFLVYQTSNIDHPKIVPGLISLAITGRTVRFGAVHGFYQVRSEGNKLLSSSAKMMYGGAIFYPNSACFTPISFEAALAKMLTTNILTKDYAFPFLELPVLIHGFEDY